MRNIQSSQIQLVVEKKHVANLVPKQFSVNRKKSCVNFANAGSRFLAKFTDKINVKIKNVSFDGGSAGKTSVFIFSVNDSIWSWLYLDG